jgi:hypothetical protein
MRTEWLLFGKRQAIDLENLRNISESVRQSALGAINCLGRLEDYAWCEKLRQEVSKRDTHGPGSGFAGIAVRC